MHKTADSVTAMLHRIGLRRTPVRSGVLALLGKAEEPMSVAEILAALPDHTDAVTVYRTLNTFTEKQLVHRVRGEDRAWRYALGTLETSRHHHPHFVCDACGHVQCLDNAKVLAGLPGKLGIPEGYDVSHAEVLLHGRCPHCAEK